MPEYKSVEQYLNDQQEDAKNALLELKKAILAAVPDAVELINYNIPAYALVPNGKRDRQVMIAGFKHHVGFYPTPAVLEKFADRLSGYKSAKGSVQFPLDRPVPSELVSEMVRYRKAMLDGKE